MEQSMWGGGTAYETYMGRWSRLVAREFLRWLTIPADAQWVDVGCGTGGLTQTVLDLVEPRSICGVEPAAGFLNHARQHIRDARARFEQGDARQLPLASAAYDVVISGLMLNFVPEPELGLAEMYRVVRPGGHIAAYVWDYAEGMAFLRYFWDAVVAGDPAASDLDEGRLFPLCHPEPLRQLFIDAGLHDVEAHAIEAAMHFHDFADYWTPFLGGQGPAPAYVMSRSETERLALRERVRTSLPIAPDGSIRLTARAWAVRSTRPQA